MEEISQSIVSPEAEIDFIDAENRTKKQKLYILSAIGGFIVVTLLSIYLIFVFTGQLTSVVADFLFNIKNQKIDEAYALMTDEYHEAVPRENFDYYIAKKRLNKIISTNWQLRETNGNQGKLTGVVVTDLGLSLPYEVYLEKQNNDWKIEKFRDVLAEEQLKILTNTQAKKVVNQTLENFTRAVEQKSFDEFYRGFSQTMKAQVSYDDFVSSFQIFFGNEVYLKDVINNSPEIYFNDVIDPDLNFIIISGRIASEINYIDFEIGVIPENEVWRVASLYLQMD